MLNWLNCMFIVVCLEISSSWLGSVVRWIDLKSILDALAVKLNRGLKILHRKEIKRLSVYFKKFFQRFFA